MQPGAIFAEQYKILERLGQGGAGDVYKAQYLPIDSVVAIKLINRLTDSDFSSTDLQKVKREARITSQLKHPGIVQLLRVGATADGLPFLVLEYVEGETLGQLLEREKTISESRLLTMLVDVLNALQYAHSLGIVHRDLKPANIILDTHGADGAHARILDFGVAKIISDAQTISGNSLATTQAVGTIPYMSPEECSGQAVGPLSDIYSLGCVMYECLTGTPPFTGETAWEIASKHVSDEPRFPPTHNQKPISEVMQSTILLALKKNPGERPQSAIEMLEMLRATGEIGIRPSVSNKKQNKSRNLALVVGTSGLLACVAVFVFRNHQLDHDSQVTAQTTDHDVVRASAMPQSAESLYLLSKSLRLEGKNDQALDYLRRAAAIDLKQKPSKDADLSYRIRSNLAQFLGVSGLKEESRKYLLSAHELWDALPTVNRVDNLISLSANATSLKNFPEAKKYALEAAEISESNSKASGESGRPDGHRLAARSWNYVATSAFAWSDLALGETSARKALYHADQQLVTRISLQSVNNLVQLLNQQRKLDEATKLLQTRVLNQDVTHEDEVIQKAFAYELLGDNLILRKEYGKALAAYDDALALAEQVRERGNLTANWASIGDRHVKKARAYFRLRKITEVHKEKEDAIAAYRQLQDESVPSRVRAVEESFPK